jgi:hypothetical protein
MLSITARVRLLSAPLVQESNKVIEMDGNMTCIHQKNVYKTSSGRFEGKSPLGRPRYGKEFCILMEHEMSYNGMQLIHLTHVVSSGAGFNNTSQNGHVPYNKFPD